MMADREELLTKEADGWAALVEASERVAPELRTLAGVVPDWSVVDLVFHCGKYAELTGGRLESMAAGTYVDVEQPEHEWQAMNDGWAAESKTLTWEQAIAAAEAGRMKARTALEALGEVDAAAATWFTDETFEHYAEHAEEIARFTDGAA